jgi:flagellar biosynthesis protein FlhG
MNEDRIVSPTSGQQHHSIVKQIEKGTTRGVTRVISFTGGKGGTGKTTLVVNVAQALARQGRRVLLFDADFGLANVDILLGIRPQRTLHDYLVGEATLEEILIPGPEGITVIPASSGIEMMGALSGEQRLQLLHGIEAIAGEYDYLLIDTQAGIGPDVMYFNAASSEVVIVMTPEPTSLTDAYSLIKVLASNYGEKRIAVIMNNVSGLDQANSSVERQNAPGQSMPRSRSQLLEDAANRAFLRLQRAVERFLQLELRLIGFVPTDPAVAEAVRQQQAVLTLFPSSSAARSIAGIAERIDSEFFEQRIKGGMQFFFQQLLTMNEYGEGAR